MWLYTVWQVESEWCYNTLLMWSSILSAFSRPKYISNVSPSGNVTVALIGRAIMVECITLWSGWVGAFEDTLDFHRTPPPRPTCRGADVFLSCLKWWRICLFFFSKHILFREHVFLCILQLVLFWGHIFRNILSKQAGWEWKLWSPPSYTKLIMFHHWARSVKILSSRSRKTVATYYLKQHLLLPACQARDAFACLAQFLLC